MKSINKLQNAPIYFSYEASLAARKAPLGPYVYAVAFTMVALGVASIAWGVTLASNQASMGASRARSSLVWGITLCCIGASYPALTRKQRAASGANYRALTPSGTETVDELTVATQAEQRAYRAEEIANATPRQLLSAFRYGPYFLDLSDGIRMWCSRWRQ